MTRIVWQPQYPEQSRMWEFMHFAGLKHSEIFASYQDFYQWSLQYPQLFWPTLCEYFDLDFTTPPHDILGRYTHMIDARWFSGATFNFAEKLLTRRDDHPALICCDETSKKEIFSYRELTEAVAHCAGGLKAAGVKTGDRVAAILPNVAYTVIAMLASASLGAIWASCSPDFGVQAAIDRFSQITPKILFINDGHFYAGKCHDSSEKILAISRALPSLTNLVICPVLNRKLHLPEQVKAQYWENFVKPNACSEFIPLPFEHPLYILFSSGTTGKPKCLVHGAGGTLLQHLKELGLHTDLKATDNLFFYTTCGWMMWNWMVSSLALGVSLTLYDGAPNFPNYHRLFELIEAERITVFGTSAKYISAVEKAELLPKQHYTLSNLRTILTTGSPLLPQNYDFVYQQIKADVQLSSISGGTDIISCFALGNPLLPVYRGELQCLGLGMAVKIFNNSGQEVYGERGELVCIQPFPSMPIYFWNDPDKALYKAAYFSRFKTMWAQGDYAEITNHNGLIIYGRSDTALNPGGVRIGTAEIYRQVETIPEIVESVVIGQKWQDDTRIILFVKLQEGYKLTETLVDIIRQTIRQNASPRHVPAKILQVPDIPHTLSGKLVEIAVRQVIHGDPIENLQSLANPQALDYFKNRQELLT